MTQFSIISGATGMQAYRHTMGTADYYAIEMLGSCYHDKAHAYTKAGGQRQLALEVVFSLNEPTVNFTPVSQYGC